MKRGPERCKPKLLSIDNFQLLFGPSRFVLERAEEKAGIALPPGRGLFCRGPGSFFDTGSAPSAPTRAPEPGGPQLARHAPRMLHQSATIDGFIMRREPPAPPHLPPGPLYFRPGLGCAFGERFGRTSGEIR
jgi:hypothetical protein